MLLPYYFEICEDVLSRSKETEDLGELLNAASDKYLTMKNPYMNGRLSSCLYRAEAYGDDIPEINIQDLFYFAQKVYAPYLNHVKDKD